MRTGIEWSWLVWSVICGCALSSDGDAIDGGRIRDSSIDASFAGTVIVGVLIPDRECGVSADSTFLLRGRYDVGDATACNSPYSMNLLLESFVPAPGLPDGFVGAAPNTVQLTDATITLLHSDGSLVSLAPRPNPFQVSTFATVPPKFGDEPSIGAALVEVVRSEDRATLAALMEENPSFSSVIVEITLTATTVEGVRVDPEPFRFPIELCRDCFTFCGTALSEQEANDLTDGQCPDNAGADGRICIDRGC